MNVVHGVGVVMLSAGLVAKPDGSATMETQEQGHEAQLALPPTVEAAVVTGEGVQDSGATCGLDSTWGAVHGSGREGVSVCGPWSSLGEGFIGAEGDAS